MAVSGYEQVLWLHVTVRYPLLVEIFEGKDDLGHIEKCDVVRK